LDDHIRKLYCEATEVKNAIDTFRAHSIILETADRIFKDGLIKEVDALGRIAAEISELARIWVETLEYKGPRGA
jgi:hypothetical protein